MARTRIDPATGGGAVRALVDARSIGTPSDPATRRTAVRYLLQVLAERAPGSSVEVRVPPIAAVQAVAGPSHRRGTPSAVVEMDPDTWLDLATGAVSWPEAVAGGRVHASGQRADLSTWLPLMRIG